MSEMNWYWVYNLYLDEPERQDESASGWGYSKVYFKSEADEVIAENEAENRKLQRALWIARAERALEKIAWFKLWNASISTMNPEDGARQEYDKWKNALGKLLKKAEQYKEEK